MGERFVTRFAPAPTGHLHIGHVVNALHVWDTARVHGGRVLLRIEDRDGHRSRPEFEVSILQDLEWLGFSADGPPVRQSERDAVYRAALERLREHDLIYACECSRREIAASAASGAELRYPGTCAGKRLTDGPGRALRLRLPWSEERFDDAWCGPQVQVPAEQCGDLLIRDRHGFWTYQFAVTVTTTSRGSRTSFEGSICSHRPEGRSSSHACWAAPCRPPSCTTAW